MPTVEQITKLLKGNPGLVVKVEGHTDNVGTPQSNKLLSEQRAKAVMAAVLKGGIAADRMLLTNPIIKINGNTATAHLIWTYRCHLGRDA